MFLTFVGKTAPLKGYTKGEKLPEVKKHIFYRMSQKELDELIRIDEKLKSEFFYKPDVGENWARPTWQWVRLLSGWAWKFPGDCEDYALEFLYRAKVPWESKRIVQCWTERGSVHAVAAIDTINFGTIVTGNRRGLDNYSVFQGKHRYKFETGVTLVPGRKMWAWNIRRPNLGELFTKL